MKRLALASRTSFKEGTGPARIAQATLLLAALGLMALYLLVRATGAVALPPGYGFEKVSPGALAKNDADIPIQLSTVRAAADGSRVTWMEYLATPGDEGGSFPGQALATLGADGWSSRGIMPPVGADVMGAAAFNNTIGYQRFDENLTKGALSQAGPGLVPGAYEEQGMRNLYVRDLNAGGYSVLTPPPLGGYTLKDTLMGLGTVFYSPVVADTTPDFGHVVFETSFLPLVEGAVGGPGGPSGFGVPNVYEWHEGQLRLASVMPNGEPAPEGAIAGGGMSGGVYPASSQQTPGDRVISDSGSHIVFTIPSSRAFAQFQMGEIYTRIDGTSTQYVSRSQRSEPDPDGPQPDLFVTASSDGRYVFFASEEKLTDDSAASVGGKFDLYRYDTANESLQDLTASETCSFSGLIGSSRDGSTIYFGCDQSVKVWSKGSLTSVVDVDHGVDFNFEMNNFFRASQQTKKRSVVSLDGRWVVLFSSDSLTGQPLGGTRQLFLYDRESGETKCVSCPARGVPGSSAYTNNVIAYASFPIIRDYYPRNFNDAGTLLTFQTADQLSPEDKNSAVDVYQYETLTGKVRLMSQGTGVKNAYIEDISADGETVFFATRERLLPEDGDGLEDLYVARFGARAPAAPPAPPCEGEACQGELSDPPAAQAVGSSLLAAPGRAKARRGAQCAKASKAKRKAKKRAGKPRKQKSKSKQRAKRNTENANAERRTNR